MTTLTDTAPRFLHAWHSQQVHEAATRMLGCAIETLTLERTHFPGKRPVQLVLTVHLADGRSRPVLAEYLPQDAELHAGDIRTSLRKTRHGQKYGLDAAAVVVAGDSGLVLRRPGLDERLPGLRLLHDPAFARTALQMILGVDTGPVAAELVAHRLGKRAVLRISHLGGDIYVRLRATKSTDGHSRLARHRSLWHSLQATNALRIPEPLGAIPDIGAAFFAALPGTPPDASADASAIARALAALQTLAPEGLPMHSGADEAALLLQWFDRCQRWQPDLARRIKCGLWRLNDQLAETASPCLPCHRDLHEKQILIEDGTAGLLDFDTACLAHPALDAGNLLAHLFFAGLNEAPLQAMLDRPGLGLWRRAALYRLAMIYAFTSTPASTLDRLIDEANHARD